MIKFAAHENYICRNYAHRNSAYTLIELLVGITIMALIFSIGFVSYRDFSRKQALTGVTKGLISDLRLIQQKALAGEKIGSCTTLNGYKINISSSSYSLYASCASDILLKTVDLTVNEVTLTLTPPIPTNTITFKVLGQGTDLTSEETIRITNSKINKTSTVVVGIGGDVQ